MSPNAGIFVYHSKIHEIRRKPMVQTKAREKYSIISAIPDEDPDTFVGVSPNARHAVDCTKDAGCDLDINSIGDGPEEDLEDERLIFFRNDTI